MRNLSCFLASAVRRAFRGWKKKRDSERNELFEEHIRRRRFVSKIFCDGIIGGSCKGRQNKTKRGVQGILP